MNGPLSLVLGSFGILTAIAGLFMAAHGLEQAFRLTGYIVTLAGVAFCFELIRRNS